MRSTLIVTAAGLVLLGACNWKAGQANSAQGNISQDNRPLAENATGTTVATPTGAPKTKDEALKIMHDRHEAMEDLGKAAKSIGRELKNDKPNLDTIRASAKSVSDIAPRAGSLFPPGTGPDVGKTGAKPAIWDPANRQDFTTKVSDFQKAAQAFGQAAGGSDVNAIKSKFADLGGTCKACHDKYRTEMKH